MLARFSVLWVLGLLTLVPGSVYYLLYHAPREQLLALVREPETREAAIDLIARENRLPRFLAKRVVALLERRLTPR
jgi:hypothetical protein